MQLKQLSALQPAPSEIFCM